MANILLANDMVALGSMTMSVVTPFMEAYGHRVAKLPTGLVSNNFAFGSYAMRDSTDYMEESLSIWHDLGFTFDAIASGFLFSDRAADVLKNYRASLSNNLWIHDPIMGDEGDFYHGLGDELLVRNIAMASVADVMVPNYTEAYLLLGEKPPAIPTEEDMENLIERLTKLGSAKWVITSVPTKDDAIGMIWVQDEKEVRHFTYPVVSTRMVGTGDLFTGYFAMSLLENGDLYKAAKDAAEAVFQLLKALPEFKETDPMGILLDKKLIDVMDTWKPSI